MSARWVGRRLATGLLAILISPILAVFFTLPGARGADQPLPTASIAAPSSPLIGQSLAFDVSFVNDSLTATGYGPYLDLELPLGADLDDGLTFTGATYLGASVTSTVLTANLSGCVTHPYAVQTSGAPVQMCGLAVNQSYVVLRLPFGSFTPGQPAATVHVTTQLSNLADAGTALTIGARGGFQFGADPLADPATDPSTIGSRATSTVTPTIMRVSKSYNGPEDETATGPNYPRSYTITVTVAPGQTVTNLTVTDSLPNSIQYLSTTTPTTPASVPVSTPSTTTPGGSLSRNFGSVTGTGGTDASMTFNFYVPRLDSGGSPILPAATGAFGASMDSASASGSWAPVDPRDSTTVVSAGPATHTLTDKSIAVQKSVGLADDTGPAGVSPGDTLAWTISVQVSDFFALGGVTVDDLLGDGTRVDLGFTPTLTVAGSGFSLSTDGMDAANYTVSAVDGGTGQTPISFRLADELVTRGEAGPMIGGCIPTTGTAAPDCSAYNDGGTTATIVFHSIVQQTYVDDAQVVEGDTLTNHASAYGTVLDTATFAPTANTAGDGSAGVATAGTSASISIQRGTLQKSIYAIDGSTSFASPVHISPGNTVTYRLRQSFPTSRTDDFRITDYLPLPVFDASGLIFDTTADATAPAAGHAKYGPSDTFHSEPGAPTPVVTANLMENSVQFAYGDYALYPPAASTADILFTVTVSTDPFADGLLLTNQARSQTRNAVGDLQTADAIVQITLDQPVLAITKGIVGTDNPAGVLAPPTAGPVAFAATAAPPSGSCPRFSGGPVTTAGLAANPIDSDLSGVDAGDYVRFAVVVQDTGHAAAFGVQISDTIPTGFAEPAGGYDTCVTDGAGTALDAVNISDGQPIGTGAGLFGQGIQLVDGAGGSLDPGLSPTDVANAAGTNLVVITYTLQLQTSVEPESTLTNTASLIDFTNAVGSSGHLASPLTDTATVTTTGPGAAKTLVGTSQGNGTDVAIGEIVTYRLTLTIPEGTTPAAEFVDTLPAGLAMLDCQSVVPSAGVATDAAGGWGGVCAATTVGTGGQLVTFNLGTLTDSNTDNAAPDTVQITYRAVVLNVAGNTGGRLLHNSAVASWTGGSLDPVSAADLKVVEPSLAVAKSADPATGDAGDTIVFTITVSNPIIANGADAHDVSFADAAPAGMSYVGSTFAQTGGTATVTSSSDAGGNLTASWDSFAQGATATFQFSATIDADVVPGTVFTNTASVAWSGVLGDFTAAQSTYNAVSTERTGDTGDPGGNLNNYRASASADVDVPVATVQKSVVDTNQSHTSGVSVAIGEIVTYAVTVTVPEGSVPNATLIDRPDSGLAFVGCDSISADADLSTTLPGGFTAACNAPTNPTVTGSGQDVTFDLGSITNSNRDNGHAEQIILTYRMVVLNVAGNVHGSTPSNAARLLWTGGDSGSSMGAAVSVDEPQMSLTKVADKTTGDAGDPITFTITVTNKNVANAADGFEVAWSDAIPSGLVYVPGSLTCTAGTCPILSDALAPALSGTWTTLTVGSSATLQYQVTLAADVQAGSAFTNTAALSWTSLPGDYSAAQSTYNAASNERSGTGISPNTYKLTAPATVTVTQPLPIKTLVGTSEAGTSGDRVAIGEIARFKVVVAIPEGEMTTASILDNLPAGLQFLNDNTATVAFVSDGAGLTSDTISGAGLDVFGIATGAGAWTGDPTFVIPSAQITGGPFVDGTDPIFNFGTLTNADHNDGDTEGVVIEFNALVENVAGNVAGQSLTDSAAIRNDTGVLQTSAGLPITVAEPSITIAKTITSSVVPAPDGGDTLVYRVAITNAAGANVSPAYELHLTDQLDSHLTIVSAVAAGAAVATNNTNYGTGAVDFTFDVIAVGTTETVDITATIADNVDAGTQIANTASGKYTSLPGPLGTTSNPTGSSTPTASGTATGERDGSGGVNNYSKSGSVAVPTVLAKPAISKLGPTNTTAPVGGTTRFDLLVTLPEGTSRGLKVIDTLPVGLLPTSSKIVVTSADSGGLFASDYSGTLPTATVTAPGGPGGGAWTFDFGDTYLAPDGSTTDGTFLIQLTTTLANTAPVQSNVALSNTAGVRYTDPVAGAVTIAAPSARTVTVKEPVLKVVKSADNTNPSFGATVKYTLTLSHAAASNWGAFDVTMTDTLPAGLTLNTGSLLNTAGLAPTSSSAVGSTITINFASFPLASTSTFTYQATVGGAGSVSLKQTLTNAAHATWTSISGADPNERTGADGVGGALNDYAAAITAPVTVSGIDMTLTKDDGQATATAGATLTYTLTYHNNGNTSATGVTLAETVPAGTTYAGSGWVCPGGSGAGNACTRAIGTVAAGATSGVTFGVKVVDPIPPSLTQISNTATITDDGSQNGDPTPGDNSATDVDQIQVADLSLAKTVDDPTPDANQVVAFTITVLNSGPAQATNVKVTDALPGSLSFVSANASQGSYVSGTGVWTVGSVNVGAGAAPTLTVNARVTTSATATNTAQVTHSDQNDPDSTPGNDVISEDDYASATVTPNVADLAVTKTVDDTHPDVASDATFTIVATNLGPSDATGVVVTDNLPAGLTYKSSSATAGSYVAATHLWTVGPLSNGASATLTLVATVATAGEITNTASVTADQFDPAMGNNTAAIATSQLVDIVVAKTVDDPAPNVGATANFTLTISNAGPGTAHDVVIHDQVPAGLTLVSMTPSQGSYSGTTADWTVGTIAASGQTTATVQVVVVGSAPMTNVATLTAVDEPQSSTANDSASATVTPPHADLSIAKAVGSQRPNTGDADFFTITVTNNGDADATGVAATDVLPAGLTFASAVASQGSFDSSDGIWNVGSLAGGASATLTLNITVSVAGDYTNTATVTGDQFDPDTSNNTDSASLSTRVADIVVTKTADRSAPTVDTTVTFTVTATNAGPDDATQLVIHDALPAGLTYISSTPSGGSYDPDTGDWTIGGLAWKAAVTLQVSARVVESGTIQNSAAVTGLLQSDPDSSNDAATASIEVPPAADLALTKSVDVNTPDKDTTVTFTVTVANHGPDATAGVHVGDLLPVGLTYVSDTPSAGTYDPISGDWDVGGMADGAVETLAITATVEVEGPLINMAQVTSSSLPDPNSTPGNSDPSENDQASVQLNAHGVADLALVKTVAPATVRKGDTATYTLVVTDNGPDPASAVIVRDQLPAGLTYVSSSGGDYDSTTGAWKVGDIPDGGSATLTITVRVGLTGSITNTATVVASDQRDPVPANGEATAGIAAAGATPPPTLATDPAVPPQAPGPLALLVLGLALAGITLLVASSLASRNGAKLPRW